MVTNVAYFPKTQDGTSVFLVGGSTQARGFLLGTVQVSSKDTATSRRRVEGAEEMDVGEKKGGDGNKENCNGIKRRVVVARFTTRTFSDLLFS